MTAGVLGQLKALPVQASMAQATPQVPAPCLCGRWAVGGALKQRLRVALHIRASLLGFLPASPLRCEP